MSKVVLKSTDSGIEIHCPKCDALMKKLYWRKTIKISGTASGSGYLFSQWYGCTDCGKTVYDKHGDVLLEALI